MSLRPTTTSHFLPSPTAGEPWFAYDMFPPPKNTPILVWLPVKSMGSHIHAAVYRDTGITIGHVMPWDAPAPTHWCYQPTGPR